MSYEASNIKGWDRSRNPLFDAFFVFQNTEIKEFEEENVKFSFIDLQPQTAKFDLLLEAIEQNDQLELSFEYCTKLFKKETVEGMGKHFANIIMEILDNIDLQISDIDMLSAEEKKFLLCDYNDTDMDYQYERTIFELFEDQVAKTPENKAVIFEDESITYKELNEKANQVAYYLKQQKIGKNDKIGVLAERCINSIVNIMGILKTGQHMFKLILSIHRIEKIIFLRIVNVRCCSNQNYIQ